ncbi:MAG: ParA family protein [Clostridiales bacterium]|nr:ParA family protein [Clostridiales bacterium]
MGKIVAVANQKGGVGKTTTCVNLCCALHDMGVRVLLCDIDPQGNATSGMGVDKAGKAPNLYDVLVGAVPAEKVVVSTKYGDVIPSNAVLSGAGIELVNAENREFVLKNALESVKDKYDYIFIDCPPSLEMLTLNALCAADSVFIPVQCEYFALEGLTDLINTIRMTKKALNPKLDIEGVLLTMFDSRTNFSMQVAEEVKKFFKGKVYNVMIPRNVRVSEAPSHGVPVLAYDKSSRGAVAYMELAKEFLRRNRG